MKFLRSRKFKIGAYGAAVTAVILLIAVAVNVIAVLLTERKNAFIDLTADKAFALSEDARKVFAELPNPVRVTVLADREDFESLNPYCAQIVYILDRAVQENDVVTVRYIDPLKNPEVSASFPGAACTQGDLVVENMETGRFYEINFADLFYFNSSGNAITGSKAEAVIASRMLSMTSGEEYKVAFTAGHSEEEAETLKELLTLNNYTLTEVSATGVIDPDTMCVILVAPKVDFSDEEIQHLEKFMLNDGEYGKSILYFASIEQPPLTNLDAFLANYGLAARTEVVGETNTQYTFGESSYYALSWYMENIYSAKAISSELMCICPYTRPVELLFTDSASVRTAPLMNFSDKAIAIDLIDTSKYRSGSEGDLYSAAVAERYEYIKGVGEVTSRLVVIGTSYFVNDSMLSTESLGNAEYIVGVMSQLAPNETSVEITPKSILGGYMSINSRTAAILGLVFVALVPLLVIAVGIYVFLRRRNK